MDLLELSTYLCNGIIALVMGSVLLLYKVEQPVSQDYLSAKRALAYCNIIGALTDSVAVMMIVKDISPNILKGFIVPAVYYVQLFLASYAMLILTHSRHATQRNAMLFSLPVVVLTLAYIWCSISTDCFDLTLAGFNKFNKTAQARFLSICLYTFLFAELAVTLYWVTTSTISYRRNTNMMKPGPAKKKANRIKFLTAIFWAYFAIATINTAHFPTGIKMFLIWINTAVFVAAVIMVLNFSSSFVIIDKVIEENRQQHVQHQSNRAQKSTTTAKTESKTTIAVRLLEWQQADERHYLQEGITLNEVARKIAVSPRALSEHINNEMHMNFNTWINTLRIEEVKRTIAANPETAMVEIAQQAGFSDSSAMTKVFKKFTGVTPTQYRNTMREQ